MTFIIEGLICIAIAWLVVILLIKALEYLTEETNMQVRVKEDPKEFGKCGCGRSPTGKCCGWHGLSEDMYAHAKMLWLEEEIKRDQELEQYQQQAQALWNDSCTAPRKETK